MATAVAAANAASTANANGDDQPSGTTSSPGSNPYLTTPMRGTGTPTHKERYPTFTADGDDVVMWSPGCHRYPPAVVPGTPQETASSMPSGRGLGVTRGADYDQENAATLAAATIRDMLSGPSDREATTTKALSVGGAALLVLCALLPLAATAGQDRDDADPSGGDMGCRDGGVLAARALAVIQGLVAALAEPTTLAGDVDEYGGGDGQLLAFGAGTTPHERRRRAITSLRVTAAAAAITDALGTSAHFNPETSGALSLDAMETACTGSRSGCAGPIGLLMVAVKVVSLVPVDWLTMAAPVDTLASDHADVNHPDHADHNLVVRVDEQLCEALEEVAFHGAVAAVRPALASTAGAMVAVLKPERVAAVQRLRSLVQRGLPLVQLVYPPLPVESEGGIQLLDADVFGPDFVGLERWLEATAPLIIDALSAAPLCSTDELAALARAIVFLWSVTLLRDDVIVSNELLEGQAQVSVSTRTTSALLGMLLTHSQAPVREAAYQAATEALASTFRPPAGVAALLGVQVEGAAALSGPGCGNVFGKGASAAWSLATATGLARQGWLGMRARPGLSNSHTPLLPLLLCNGLHDGDSAVKGRARQLFETIMNHAGHVAGGELSAAAQLSGGDNLAWLQVAVRSSPTDDATSSAEALLIRMLSPSHLNSEDLATAFARECFHRQQSVRCRGATFLSRQLALFPNAVLDAAQLDRTTAFADFGDIAEAAPDLIGSVRAFSTGSGSGNGGGSEGTADDGVTTSSFAASFFHSGAGTSATFGVEDALQLLRLVDDFSLDLGTRTAATAQLSVVVAAAPADSVWLDDETDPLLRTLVQVAFRDATYDAAAPRTSEAEAEAAGAALSLLMVLVWSSGAARRMIRLTHHGGEHRSQLRCNLDTRRVLLSRTLDPPRHPSRALSLIFTSNPTTRSLPSHGHAAGHARAVGHATGRLRLVSILRP